MVSTATVSRCLNSPQQVVADTRARVMQAVEDLGYTPNFGARVMAAKRTFTIGAIIPTMENAVFARGLQAFQEELRERGYTLLVASSAYQPEVEAAQIRALVARGADGLLLIGYERSNKITTLLQAQNIPTLVAWTYSGTNAQPSVGFDNRAAMSALTREVLDHGHRDIGFISFYVQDNDRARERLIGLKETLQDAGLPTNALRVIETSYGVESGGAAFEQMMCSGTPPTAVMCGNDVLAVGALRQAREMGMSVPDDVSITGFDDLELARIVTPALTTVHVPHRKMGRAAARELVMMVEKKTSGTSIELDSWIVTRESLDRPAR